ncbi:MAG TPA: hypothetical protein VET82_03320 [Candidatus Eisenbacteria bacterium]|nr:hypothetical protein [Candidatus Eisenbacteria bacterium]
MRAQRAGWIAVIVGLILAALLHPHFGPPMYEGAPPPEPPYRYMCPPPDLAASNQAPQSGQATLPIHIGEVPGGGTQTDDAQVLVFFGPGALRASSTAQTVTIRIDPVACGVPPPPGSQIRGNVYRIAATEDPGGAAPIIVRGYNVTMRYPPGPFTELQLYDGSTWHPLRSAIVGGRPYAGATATAFGEIAATAQPSGWLTTVLAVLESYGLLAFIIVFGGIAVAQEIRRRRRI